MGYIFQQEQSKYLDNISAGNFETVAIELFNYQYNNNVIYKNYVDALKIKRESVTELQLIPFMPVSFFRTHKVVTGSTDEFDIVFSSSTTTSDLPGKHYIADRTIYEASCLKGFKEFYGNPEDYIFLALLPSYLQREGASLVYMVERLMEHSRHRNNGFYLDNFDELYTVLNSLDKQGEKIMLIGVTFALLDFAAIYQMQLEDVIVMETGGMKGRRKEVTRSEVHEYLKRRLGVKEVHSEYGMTELLSQAYALKDGIFKTSSTMKVMVRDMNDPFEINTQGTGCINIIDLANVHSCAFIATDDIGRIYGDGSFEVLGRSDSSALRGCNLMVI